MKIIHKRLRECIPPLYRSDNDVILATGRHKLEFILILFDVAVLNYRFCVVLNKMR